jgi:hypothetical protein
MVWAGPGGAWSQPGAGGPLDPIASRSPRGRALLSIVAMASLMARAIDASNCFSVIAQNPSAPAVKREAEEEWRR